MEVFPSDDVEVIVVTPAIVEKLTLEDRGHGGGHRFRAGAGQLRRDLDGRELDPRDRGHRSCL